MWDLLEHLELRGLLVLLAPQALVYKGLLVPRVLEVSKGFRVHQVPVVQQDQ